MRGAQARAPVRGARAAPGSHADALACVPRPGHRDGGGEEVAAAGVGLVLLRGEAAQDRVVHLREADE